MLLLAVIAVLLLLPVVVYIFHNSFKKSDISLYYCRLAGFFARGTEVIDVLR